MLIYLDVAEVYLVVLEEADEFLEVVFCWEIVTTVWPYSLKKRREERSWLKKNNNNNGKSKKNFTNSISLDVDILFVVTSRTPSWATNLPAAVVAPPERKLEC